ncbi:substrate-binding periplasmic protein [Mangrovitalea sediminis]|uniref:substrate-binding periplasmic protein n=1 Tax=Mangrovitalea sediminis TaxID=1982043 RepID=UPI0013042383|nr:transporter substrate-binding domain-containing protein [Mangrovitalea sediminis]
MRVNQVPPQYMEKNGQWVGLGVDRMKALLHEAGCVADFVSMPWKRSLVDLASGRIDGMINVNFTPERARDYWFLWYGHNEDTVLVMRKDDANHPKNFQDVLNLPGKIAYETGDLFGPPLMGAIKRNKTFNAKLVPLTEAKQYRMLTYRRVTAVLDMEENARYELATNPEWSALTMVPLVVSSVPDFMAFSKASVSKELFMRLEKANIRVIANGSYRAITQAWQQRVAENGKWHATVPETH